MKRSLRLKLILLFLRCLSATIISSAVLTLSFLKNNGGLINGKNIHLYIIMLFVIFIVIAIIGVKSLKKHIIPIEKFTELTKKIVDEEYIGHKIYINTKDELENIADNFNEVSKKLKNTIFKLKNNGYEMEIVLSNMSNGVIAMDNEKNVILINPAAKEMLQIEKEQIIGKNFEGIVHDNDILKPLEKLSLQNNSIKTEITLDHENIKNASLTYNLMKSIDNPNKKYGTVIIIQDITEIKKLEIMRKEFVANVTHELKTPLTSIKGFVETLKNSNIEDEDIKHKFLDIIDIETDRLTFLIQDILILSEIENEKTKHTDEKINIGELINTIVDLLRNKINKKNINIIIKIEDSIKTIYENKAWLQQIIINLLDNSIKYTQENGYVKIEITEKENKINFKIEDNGIGIPEDNLNRIFERFYRIDKSRNREEGGTGLGLSIVKNVVLLLNGEIEVYSKENVGTFFVIKLPAKKEEKI